MRKIVRDERLAVASPMDGGSVRPFRIAPSFVLVLESHDNLEIGGAFAIFGLLSVRKCSAHFDLIF
jgi:hypothetical protein